jgi:hypothetical protein
MRNYRSAITNMCNSFEAGLSEFIRSVGNNLGKESTRTNVAHETGQPKNKPKRRRAAHFPQSVDERVVHEKDEEEISAAVKPDKNDAAAVKPDKNDAPDHLPETKSKKRKLAHKGMGGARDNKKSMEDTSMPNNEVKFDEDGANEDVVDKSLEEEDEQDVTMDSHVSDLTANAESSTVNTEAITEPVVLPPSSTDGVAVTQSDAPGFVCTTADVLKHLQLYGSGSQSSAEATPVDQANGGSKSSIKVPDGAASVPTMVSGKSKKKVTFADKGKKCTGEFC